MNPYTIIEQHNLLSKALFSELFYDGEIYYEKVFLLKNPMIAIKNLLV